MERGGAPGFVKNQRLFVLHAPLFSAVLQSMHQWRGRSHLSLQTLNTGSGPSGIPCCASRSRYSPSAMPSKLPVASAPPPPSLPASGAPEARDPDSWQWQMANAVTDLGSLEAVFKL